MSAKAAELFEQLAGQLATDVAVRIKRDVDLDTDVILGRLDYDAIAEKTMNALDLCDLASDVHDRLDYTDIASNLDMGDLAREVVDELDYDDVASNLDTSEIASTICNEHGDMIAADVCERLKATDKLSSMMAEIADERIADRTDFLMPENRRIVLAADVADRLKQSDDMRDMFAEIAHQLVQKEVRRVLIKLICSLNPAPEQSSEPVDLGELRLQSVAA